MSNVQPFILFILQFVRQIFALNCQPQLMSVLRYFSELHIIYRLSVTIPSVSTNALGYGAFLGLYANLRYQLLCGFDKAVVHHFDVIGVALVFSTALRYVAFWLFP